MARIATFYDHILDIARQENIFPVEAMKLARQMGVELLEASANNVLGREDEVGQELAMADLGLSAIPAYFDFGRDQDVERQAAPILEAAQYLGAPKLLVIPGFWGQEDSPQQREEAAQRMVQCVARLGELALGYGVSLVMEEYDNELSPIATAQGVRRFVDGCPGLACAFDTGNFRFAAQDLGEAYQLLGDSIGHVHLKDRSYTQRNGEGAKTALDGVDLYPAPVGGGDLPLEEVMALLKRDGYDGVYTIEHYGANRCLEYLEQSVAWVKARLG